MNVLSDLLFPQRCPFCSARRPLGKRGVCEACEKDLPYVERDKIVRTIGGHTCAVTFYYERMVREAIHAVDALAEQGIHAGILLCEYVKPYDQLAARISKLIDDPATPIVFLEEEIRAGGFGMMLSDAMVKQGTLPRHAIMAIDDNFVVQTKNESVYTTAGIDADCIVRTVHTLLS